MARWKDLMTLAEAEVGRTLAALPAALREPASTLPVTYEPCPSEEVQADGFEPDTLGLFVGEPLAEAGATAAPLPAQIILYLENLWDFAGEDEEIYLEEVRITYLHELGHYLGLEEDELTDRGLE